ncbi:MAG: hypothetical protein ACTSQE_15515 [Candidatus Heimdallarchaeaceae archaeon]
MSIAFGQLRTIPATDKAKEIMRLFVSKEIFNEQRDVWQLGAALGISHGEQYTKDKRETFQNVNSLDPEGIFGAIVLGMYPDATDSERLNQLVDYAEWGIRELYERDQRGTLDFSILE